MNKPVHSDRALQRRMWALAYANMLITEMESAKARRAANGQPEKCKCGVRLTMPTEVISGVCIFCRTPTF